jgi:hypothetical protein
MLWFKGQQSTIYRSKTTRLFLVKEALTMARQPGSKAGRSSAGKSTLFSALLCLLIMLLRLVVLFKSSALLGVHRDVRTSTYVLLDLTAAGPPRHQPRLHAHARGHGLPRAAAVVGQGHRADRHVFHCYGVVVLEAC